ncbi:hypothetical protein EDF62_1566 [Leucobacter luti]|uniref:Uncharacterized protein n=1 Tax=Leucobacter luti TaxID=340320 RepID=A0A4R6RZ07_9MICO|nr:hypothetical protein EDF62_1566 [Leucobacter luti]
MSKITQYVETDEHGDEFDLDWTVEETDEGATETIE